MAKTSSQPVRGTHDLLPEAQAQHNIIVEIARTISERFGFQEMSTPIFEFAQVFKRTLGDASDIVNKEMYVFNDRGGDELVLRPEGTAGIARAFISEGLAQRAPLKLFYQGPMFRYERPQKGRQRQFHQIGIELLGVASAYGDVECLTLAYEILKALGITGRSELQINSLGDTDSRARYNAELVKFLQQHQTRLSADSQKRLSVNPLRILDSKDEGDRELLRGAPVIPDFYNTESKQFFATVTDSLRALGIPFNIDPFLVRGLDYYTHCVFEFRSTDLGAQNAIIAGGRYDQLIEQMGGPATPSFGWGAGIERLAMLTSVQAQRERPIAVIPVHQSVEQQAFELCYRLRAAGLTCEIAFTGNLSKRLKRATNQNSWAAVMLGPDELARGEATVKLLDASEQKNVALDQLVDVLRSQSAAKLPIG